MLQVRRVPAQPEPVAVDARRSPHHLTQPLSRRERLQHNRAGQPAARILGIIQAADIRMQAGRDTTSSSRAGVKDYQGGWSALTYALPRLPVPLPSRHRPNPPTHLRDDGVVGPRHQVGGHDGRADVSREPAHDATDRDLAKPADRSCWRSRVPITSDLAAASHRSLICNKPGGRSMLQCMSATAYPRPGKVLEQ